MYCKHCGNEIADDSRFCNHCGSPVEALTKPAAPEPVNVAEFTFEPEDKPQEPRRASFAEFQWNVEEYPSRTAVEKTEDVDFNWNASPEEISEAPKKNAAFVEPQNEIRGEDLEQAVFGQIEFGQIEQKREPEELSAAERIDKFFTFNKKNEEFQKLINNEYERVKSGNAIQHEMTEADKIAEERFTSLPENTSMESFFEREGIVKPYQPKEFQSDVLERINAQESQKEAKRLEEEARLAAIEEARLAAEAEKKAEEEARIKAEEEARMKAEAEALRLKEIAQRKAEEEARAAEEAKIKAQEEARLRAEEEARLRAAEEARIKAEAEAKVRAAEEARLKAEADLKAAQEAARIRAQQEARLAAEEEARFRAEQEKRQLEAAEAQVKLEEERQRLAEEANEAVAQEEIRKVLEQTARMRKEEEAKIKAAVAGLRGGAAPEISVKNEVAEAHEATRNQINEMAKARDAFFAEMDAEEAPKVTGRETMLSSDDLTRTRVIDKAAIAAGLNEPTKVASIKPAPAPADDDEFFNSLEMAFQEQPQTEDEKPVIENDDFLSQFESINKFDDEMTAPDENHGLNDTVIMTRNEEIANAPANDFDSYGNQEAEEYINRNTQEFDRIEEPKQTGFDSQALDDFYADDTGEEEFLTYSQQKKKAKEQKKLEKKNAKLAEKGGMPEAVPADEVHEDEEYHDDSEDGKGGIVLKIILALLIIILAVEVAGIAIKSLLPHSKAAEFIDTQLNKVIQMITGEDTEYDVAAHTIRLESAEDKTYFISSQSDNNVISGSIGEIVYQTKQN